MNIKVDGVRTVIKKLDLSNEAIANGILKGINLSSEKVIKSAKLLAPTNTGHLKGNGIQKMVKPFRNEIIAEIKTNVDYAIYVEFGTGPIGAKSKKIVPKGVNLKYKETGWAVKTSDFPDFERYGFKALTTSDGEEIILTRGQKAQQFMTPAIRKNKKAIKNIINDAVKDSLKRGV